MFASLAQGAGQMVRVCRRYEPNADHVQQYEALYRIYCDAYEALAHAQIFDRLSRSVQAER